MAKACVLIGNGPSLRDIDMKFLKDVDTISFNRAYLSYNDEEWGFDPTYYCVIDGDTIRCTIEDIVKLTNKPSKTKRFFVNNTKGEFDLSGADHSRLTEFKAFRGKVDKSRFAQWEKTIPSQITDLTLICNVSAFAIPLLYCLGYDTVGMIGCDAKYVVRKDVEVDGKYESGPLKGRPKVKFTSDKDPNHYRSDYHGSDHLTSTRHINGVAGNELGPWNQAKGAIAPLSNFKVYSCTPESRMNGIFPYMPFSDFRNRFLEAK
jgi:hypothetical protein